MASGNLPAIPATVVLRLMDPIGAISTRVYGQAGASIVAAGSGAYFYDHVIPIATPVPDAGREDVWRYRWEGLGSNQSAVEASFTVRRTSFT